MATAYTSILKLALPVQGELSGTWGDVVNDNITSMVEEAIAGRAVINTWTTNSHTLTSADGTTSESRCAMLEFTDTGTALTGDATVICPAQSKIYICKNDAGQKVTIKTSAGTGVAIADGQTMFVFCDGTNVVEAVTSMSSLKLGTAATSVQVTAVLDEDNMVSDSATALATQQSIKAYVDSQVTAQDLDFAGDTGTGAVDLDSQSLTIAGTTNEIETSASGQTLTVGLPSAIIVTTSVTTPTVQTTNLNANDGTAAVTIADATGQTTINDAVLTTADINAGTIDNTTIGATTASTGAFTTITSSGNTTVSGSLVTDTIAEETATAGVTIDSVLLKDGGATLTGNLVVDTDTLYVDSTNNRVGVGTTSPSQQLHLSNSSPVLRMEDTDVSSFAQFDAANGNLSIQADQTGLTADSFIRFQIDSAERLRIDSSGRVLIGGLGTTLEVNSDDAGLQLTHSGELSYFSQARFRNNTASARHYFAKSRSTTTGTYGTIVQDGDSAGQIIWTADDGVDGNSQVASIDANVDGTPGADDMPGRLVFSTTADGANSVTERMRIDSAGNVGIGTSPETTTSTYKALELGYSTSILARTAANQSYFVNNAYHSSDWKYKTTDPAALYQQIDNQHVFFNAASGTADTTISFSEAMRIDSSQRVLIGTSTARSTAGHTGYLQVEGSGDFNEATVSIVGNENNSNGAYLNFGSSRGTTAGSNTIVQDGDVSGQIQFTAADGTDMVSRIATITAKIDGTPGANDTPGLLDFATTADGSSDPTLRMRILSSGDVGIGTANPNFYTGYTTLTINGTSGGLLDFETNGTMQGEIYANGTSGLGLQSVGATGILFKTNSTNAVTIDSSQRVYVGSALTVPQKWWNSSSYGTLFGVENNNLTNANFYVTGGFIRNSADSEGPQIGLGKSRGTTSGATTIVQNGDTIGLITAQGADGTNLVETTRIWSQVDGTPGANDMPGRLIFSTTSDGNATPSERMRINQSSVVISNSGSFANQFGNATRTNLQVDGSGESIITLSVGGTYQGYFHATSTAQNRVDVLAGVGRQLSLWSNGATRAMNIDTSGRVLIGHTSSPTNIWGGQQNYLQVIGTSWDGSGLGLHNYNNSTTAANISFSKSRGTIGTGGTIVQNGDYLGFMNFSGDDGTDLNSGGAQIFVQVDGTPGVDDMPGRIVFRTTADGASSPTERMQISNSGHIQIGRSFSQTDYAVSISMPNQDGQLQLYNYGGIGSSLVLNDSNWSTKIRGNAGTLEFYSGGTGTKSAWFNTSRNLVFPNGNGIDFNASAGSGASSSLLDDYEEGTWTPALEFGGNTTGIVFVRAEGKYTKIGNVVHIIGHFLLSSKGTATGHAEVTGLPFTCNSNTNGAFTPLGDRGNLNTGGEGVSAYLQNSASVFLYRGGFDGGNNETVTNSHFENNTEIDLNFSYIAS